MYESGSKRYKSIMKTEFRSILGGMKGRSKKEQFSWRMLFEAKQEL